MHTAYAGTGSLAVSRHQPDSGRKLCEEELVSQRLVSVTLCQAVAEPQRHLLAHQWGFAPSCCHQGRTAVSNNRLTYALLWCVLEAAQVVMQRCLLANNKV